MSEEHNKMMERINSKRTLEYAKKQHDLLSRIQEFLSSDAFKNENMNGKIAIKLNDFEKEIDPLINEEFGQILYEYSEEFQKWKEKYPNQYDRWLKKSNPSVWEQKHSSQNTKS